MGDQRERVRSHWGWGYEDAMPTEAEVRSALKRLAPLLGAKARDLAPAEARPLDEVELRASRISASDAKAAAARSRLEAICRVDPRSRAQHAYGRNFFDVLRGFRGEYPNPPDIVAYPENEGDLTLLLEWCADVGAAAIPYGGGTSVVGGVEPVVDERYAATVSIDLSRLDRVLEVEPRSRVARIQAGVLGPALEAQLRPHGLTLRHFPQSFELSSLGGWIATRAGGHYATLHTHIDDFVSSLRVLTPRGVLETRRLPASGAGLDANRMFIGSEGALGIITEAWMRLVPRPIHRAKASALFRRFDDAVEAARLIAQSGLHPANCRLLDGGEAFGSGAARDGSSVLLLAFESADHPVDGLLDRAVEIASANGARVERAKPAEQASSGDEGRSTDSDAAGSWRQAFVRAPYLLNTAVAAGLVVDTFETAVSWDRFAELHAAVSKAVRVALNETAGGGVVMCRFTHVYPDGPAPYFTFYAPAIEGGAAEIWRAAREAGAEAVLASGGTITHHHAVGRLHRPWYDKERPQLFGDALAAAKRELDPAAVLNPGVLVG